MHLVLALLGVIGTIRRELLDHVIVLNEGHLRRRLRNYFRYYHGSRTHLALDKDAPEPRAVESPAHGQVVEGAVGWSTRFRSGFDQGHRARVYRVGNVGRARETHP